MSNLVYDICLPLAGQPDGYVVVASAQSPEGAGAVVRALLEHRTPTVSEVWIRVRTEIRPVS